MITIALFAASLLSPSSTQRCEELGRRLDGTFVTVCDGKVVRVRDSAGNSRTWEHPHNTMVVRLGDGAAVSLGFDGR